ncbi:cupin domain-containing protein [Devosia neptuniae]|uniref:Cupin domain-containing protein n=1 Tax=Devosia neptuniae TaxID=191302 RepID=A0ABY6CIH5_9HYPH|nr:cupin domain-containing protein [Devosia neptuniae]UXN72037.1 cupin domain-containing protein [Devosia neptuniae]
MKIQRAGSQPSGKGPAEWFTGAVRIDPLYGVEAPNAMAGNIVTFEPGARTAWHTYLLGQTLIIMAGRCLVQKQDGPLETVLSGDVVRFGPGEKHWHGASAETAMTDLATQESLDGKAVDWLEQVSDPHYAARANNTLKDHRS